MPTKLLCVCGLALFSALTPLVSHAQRFLSEYDSTLFIRDTVLTTVRRFENMQITGYMQPQFQVAQREGAQSYEGGNFGEHVNNRFMLRRARVKLDYILPSKDQSLPRALFTFQFEATERDLNVRDVFVRLFEPLKQNLSVTMGLFSRPFGYEVNLSSAFRETLERGRMSQILMPSERDLGAMISYEKQQRIGKLPHFKFDIGVFNGQGKSGPAEFDSYKDIISRLSVRPVRLSKSLSFTAGLSFLNGGWRQQTRYRYETIKTGDKPFFMVDSSLSNIGGKALRRYHGADAQLVLKHGWGKTEWRAEYWWGTQPGTVTTTVNPGTLPEGPTYIRRFDGAFFYFLQNIVNRHWELMVKYDWYDPNKRVAATEIAKEANFNIADVRYNTLGTGITHYFSDNLKAILYYSIVRNEKTLLNAFTNDLPDNVLTFRIQIRF